jgi:hypothetical protein
MISEEEIDDILFNIVESDTNGFGTVFSYNSAHKALKIAYLKGVLKYTIAADYISNGEKIFNEYEEQLKRLTNGK